MREVRVESVAVTALRPVIDDLDELPLFDVGNESSRQGPTRDNMNVTEQGKVQKPANARSSESQSQGMSRRV